MNLRRVVLIPPAAPGSKGDEGMVRGALELFDTFEAIIVNPEPSSSWLEKLGSPTVQDARITEIRAPMSRISEQLREGDLLFFIGADVIDGTCGLQPALERLELAADALLHGIAVFAVCSFRARVAPEILERLRLMGEMNFLLRDDDSLANFHRQTGIESSYFPDISLFAKNEESIISNEIAKKIDRARQIYCPIVGVNFAEHSFRSFFDTHSLENRKSFVASIMRELVNAHPAGYFVFFSNDERRWQNHPSDDDYAELALSWIGENLEKEVALKINSDACYGDNISILQSVDILVTGRMHLSLAAFRAAIVPLVVMGEGKGYTSIDKMRGAFRKFLGTTDAVISSINEIGPKSLHFLARREKFKNDLQRLNSTLTISNRAAADALLARLRAEDFPIVRKPSSFDAAAVSILGILARRSEELALERAASDRLRSELVEERIRHEGQQQAFAAQCAAHQQEFAAQRTAYEALRDELEQTRAALDLRERQLEEAQIGVKAVESTLGQMQQSMSWRMTKPVRAVSACLPQPVRRALRRFTRGR